MEQDAISKAMAQGAPITCATCRHFHIGNKHCGKSECGGPGVGLDFPLYDGPIPRDKFVERCLICGSGEVKYHIAATTDQDKFSLCRKHRKVYNHVGAAEGKLKHPITLITLP